MSKYVRNPIVKVKFDGDDVSVVLTPITLEERFKLEDEMPDKTDSPEVKAEKNLKVFHLSRGMLKEHIQKIEGLRDAANVDIGVEEVFRDAYFRDLCSKIFRGWYALKEPVNPEVPASSSTDASEDSNSTPKTSTGVTAG